MTDSQTIAQPNSTHILGRLLVSIYGLVAYGMALVTIVAFGGFLIDYGLPFTVNRGVHASIGEAVLVDLLLILVLGLQHTIMARPTFKRWWTRIVPTSIERSTYLFATAGVFALLMMQWRPIDVVVWHVQSPTACAIAYGIFALGWVIVFLATFLIDHYELMGLRQTCPAVFRPSRERLHTPLLYRLVRHPMMSGFILTFWATPNMTAGHLLLAAGLTLYILIALVFEERTLLERFGDSYASYSREVPKLCPHMLRSKSQQ